MIFTSLSDPSQPDDGVNSGTNYSFFENINQMGILRATIMQLQHQWIITVDGLAYFDKDSLQQLVDNLCHPSGRVPDPNLNAGQGATTPTAGFLYGAKPQRGLLISGQMGR